MPARALFQAAILLIAGAVLQAQTANDRRIDDLIRRMTLDEKIGQMSQSTSMQTPVSDTIKNEIRAGRWGSFLNAGSPTDRAEAQRIALHESRLGIPLIFGRDVIHGYRTIFPIPLGQAASWDTGLIEKAARIAALEATSEGIQWAFAPMLDVARDPRWGRIAESPGEDPYLAGAIGVAIVHGYQGQSLAAPGSLAACVKHFAGYGAVEAGRDYNSTWIPEILLRDVYLRPFLAARQAGVASFMTAFTALNGVPDTGNPFLLRQILRDEWRFDGLVVSDYTAIPEMVKHGYAADDADAGAKALNAGVDMEMVSTTWFDHMKDLLRTHQVDMKSIDAAVRDILNLKSRLGLFDGKRPAPVAARITTAARQTAQKLAAESLVLLKNEANTLPLSQSIARIAVIGPLADSPVDQMGSWAMDGRADDVQTPLATLRARLGSARVAYAPGLKNSRDVSRDGFAEAVTAARSADVALLFLGEEQILSGEARSRAFLNLPGAQAELVDAVAAAGKPVIAIILAGRPLTFHDTAAKCRAILYAWHPGTMGGPAIADLLFGDSVPSGKLPVTFPRTVGQVPIYYAHLNTGRPPSASDLGIPLGNPLNPTGYTSKYVDVDYTPEYPFGYGLSYTALSYSNLRLSGSSLHSGGTLRVSADIENRGNREADEVAQLYIHQRVASVSRPVRELKGFQRIHLKPGEKETVSFSLSPEELAFWNSHNRFVTEPGTFDVWISPDSTQGIRGEFTLDSASAFGSR
ncbi:MAG TPA: glycoside hydrolase family 3 N-terminal domain-containing protein [Bryobacteraceae bacterium]|jgi:beta-glucosidase|nr:glycoside hydrolase family 3 N-terminal domain-containing protein [Bryobacteraceae bacterium]